AAAPSGPRLSTVTLAIAEQLRDAAGPAAALRVLQLGDLVGTGADWPHCRSPARAHDRGPKPTRKPRPYPGPPHTGGPSLYAGARSATPRPASSSHRTRRG